MTSQQTIVFVHAHPDDEAIFTAGTMSLLCAAGHRVILVVATSGELGTPQPGDSSLDSRRQQETIACCQELGPVEVRFLGFEDSGLHGENPNGFAHVPRATACDVLVDALRDAGPIQAIVSYDDHGIYGHPDHVHVHDVVASCADRLDILTVYESTVDREYLHFVRC